MIITFSGDHGSGKSTIAKKIAKYFGYERVYMGQVFRDLAQKKGLTLVEYLKSAEKDPSIDKNADEYIVQLAREKDDLVIESRTAWHFIPDSLKIYLQVDEEEGARRMLKHLQGGSNRSNEDKNLASVKDIIESSRKRKATDSKRYKKYYGIDVFDLDNYDFVLDTTNMTIEQVFDNVADFIKIKMKKG